MGNLLGSGDHHKKHNSLKKHGHHDSSQIKSGAGHPKGSEPDHNHDTNATTNAAENGQPARASTPDNCHSTELRGENDGSKSETVSEHRKLSEAPPDEDTRETHFRVIDEYKVFEKCRLGGGAFGAVVKGEHATKGTKVAVKKVDHTEFSKYTEEAKCLQGIHSPYVVKLIGHKTVDPFTYLIMELCDTDLGQILVDRKFLSLKSLDTVIRHVAAGYKAVSDTGIVHRDIKPQNILIVWDQKETAGEDGHRVIHQVKLTDFGFGKIGDMRKMSVVGTPIYMAPEIAANVLKRQSYRNGVDMWSIGVVFFQAAVGEIPFTENDQARQILWYSTGNFDAYDPPELPNSCKSRVPSYFEKTVTKLLQLDPEKRPTPKQLCSHVGAK